MGPVRIKRRTKEAAAAVALVASMVGIIVLVRMQMTSDQTGYGLAILLLTAVCLMSMVALVTFSRTGWKVEGSKEEWALAIVLNPSGLLFWNKDFKEQTGDARREDEYNRSRDR